MKKILSVLLAVVMAVSVMVPAFATEEKSNDYDGAPVIIVRGIDFAGLTYEDGSKALNVQLDTLFPVITKALFARLNVVSKETVIDAYCGTGTISLYLAQKARKVYGVEIVSPAIKDAEKNARENNVRNAEFIVGDCTKVMPRLYKQGVRPDVVVVDPPRAGCTQQVLETFANMQPQRIVYVSCNPATLARDIEILDGLGYKAEKVQPVDMFSHSSHVENVCLLKMK